MIKVLVVEDENFIRKGLIGTFDWIKSDCIVVGEAENGAVGLEKIQGLRPDLVITDIRMPKMNGIEMLLKAKEIYNVDSFILSSYDDFSYAKQAIDLRVFDYILKPIEDDYLEKALVKFKEYYNDKKLSNKLKETMEDNKTLNLINLDYYQTKNIYDKYTRKIIDYITQNYNDKISIEDVAEEYSVSVSYLSRQFKSVTAHTFHDFLNKYRIQKSIELLQSGNYKVYEVSEMVGFSEYKHFSTVFKKYMMYSPSEFIKNYSNNF